MRPLLLVEDERSDVLFFERALSLAGDPIPLRVARDGAEALAYLEGSGAFADRARHPVPLLVALDLKLPQRSGLEILEWMRGTPGLRDIPVVVLTSSRESQDVARAQELGIDAYEVKPVHFPDFLNVVRSIRARWVVLSKKTA